MTKIRTIRGMKGASTIAAIKGEYRTILVDGKFIPVVCGMLLGLRCDPATGKEYRECIWHRVDSGRSIHGSAHENWVTK